MFRKILYSFLFVLLILIFWNGRLVWYGINMGIGQFSIIWKAKPVEEVMQDINFSDSLKARLQLIDEVRKFAIDSLGLRDTDNYKTLYDQKGKEIMWVVTACEPFALKSKVWKFPFAGTVPYKGFFDAQAAKKQKEQLEKEGYDVSVWNPGGWSTLGWFKEPILSGMLNRSEGDLASLIIHEMVHATFWMKDSVDFNENLASFIGDTAAYDFLAFKYGIESKPYITYLYEDQDYRKYSRYILKASLKLDSFYHALDSTAPLEIKRKKKEEMMRSIVANMDTLHLTLNKKPSSRFSKQLPNNTYFMTSRYYRSKQNVFEEEFDSKFHGDLKGYIAYLSKKYPID